MRSGFVAYFVQFEVESSLLPADLEKVRDQLLAFRVNAGADVAAGVLQHGVNRVHPIRHRGITAWVIESHLELAPVAKVFTDQIVVGFGRGRARLARSIAVNGYG